MWLLGKKNVQKFAPVLNSKYYTEWVTYLERLLTLSRQKTYYQDSVNLLGLQFALAKNIAQGESLIAEGKRRKAKTEKSKNIQVLEDLEVGIASNRQIVRIAKVIADGLAWRVLEFDRPFLRMMSESKRYFGSVQLSQLQYGGIEKAAIRLVSNRGSKVLLNDITHFLRLGDLVEVGDRTTVYEVKKSGRILKSVYTFIMQHPKAKTSKQLRHILRAQLARDFRKIVTNKETIEILEIPLKFKNNLKAVSQLINQARTNTYSYTEFENYLAVSCKDSELLIQEMKEKEGEVLEKFNEQPDWNKSDLKISYSNLDTFFDYEGDFLRNHTPYSIYPFNSHNCMGLMSGKLLLITQLNISEIKRMFAKNKWKVIEVDIDAMLTKAGRIKKNLFTGELYEYIIDDTIFCIKRNGFTISIPWGWITRIATEFIKPEVLLDKAEFIYKGWKSEKTKFVPFILGEKDVWR